MTSREKKQKLLLTRKIRTITGNLRSFSNKSNRRQFRSNVHKFKIAGKKYQLTARDFRSFVRLAN